LTGALEPDSRFRAAFEWFNAMEDQERREKESRRDFDFRLPELQLVRNAIVRMLPVGFSNPRTETRPLRFVIDRKMPDGETRTLRISQLSDGYRVVLGLAMDLARRMAQANSRMAQGGNPVMNPLDLPAIALIDEVDLHLHPVWQQRVLADLTRTFPGTQFIVTTHSPQVLSTVKRENIRVIGPDASGATIAEPPLQ
jgi:predicted ATP-binding protein involved in virulence